MTQSWNGKNIFKIYDNHSPEEVDDSELDTQKLRKKIEPWLTALIQSEHLSLLVGTRLSNAAHHLAKGRNGAGMEKIEFSTFKEQIDRSIEVSAIKAGRGTGNIEDQIRVANELVKELEIYISTNIYGSAKLKKDLEKLEREISKGLSNFANKVLESERNIITVDNIEKSVEYLTSFLVSFASRSSTRERLNIFTTNYDRVIEFGAELAGIRLIDRFVGTINPIFRSSRLEVDMHYNPPGIRGEPRYLEEVAHFTKSSLPYKRGAS